MMWEFPVLSKKEKATLVFIKDYMSRNCSAPSLKEIGAYFGNKSSSTPHRNLDQLVAKGYIERNQHHARSLVLTDLALNFLGERQLNTLPLYGMIRAGPCGEWNFDDLHVKEYIEVPNSTIKAGRYVMRVKGDSMDAFIHDNDYVVIENARKNIPHNRIVVALLNGSAYIKRFIKRSDGQIVLRSENPDYEDILVHKEDNFHIEGELVQVIRNYKR